MVLAGGQSRRFGSDKALALFRGEPLLVHALLGLLREGFDQVLVAWKPGDAERDKAYGAAIVRAGASIAAVADLSPAQTPLSGLAAGLAASRHELVFACGADMPFAADAALLDALFASIESHDAAEPESEGAPQPLCALWRRGPALEAARELLLLEKPAGPRALLQKLRTARLAWPDPRPFLDADTPQALQALIEARS